MDTIINPDQERVKKLLHDTVLMLCKSGLKYKEQLEIKGVIGITIDRKDVVIVHIKDLHIPGLGSAEMTQQVSSCTTADMGATPTKRIKTENFSDDQSYGGATPSVASNIRSNSNSSSVLFFTDDLDNQSSLSSSQISNVDVKPSQWALAIPQAKSQNTKNPNNYNNFNNNNNMNMNIPNNNNNNIDSNYSNNINMSPGNINSSGYPTVNQMVRAKAPIQHQLQQQQQRFNTNQMGMSPMMQTPQKQMALMALTPRKVTPLKQTPIKQQQSPYQQQQQQSPFQQQQQFPNYQEQQQQQFMSPTPQSRGRARGSRGLLSSTRGRGGRGRAKISAMGDDGMGMMMGKMGAGLGGKISVENKTIDDFSYDKETITHYKCKLCGMSYTSHSGLLTHQVKSHGRQKKAGVGRKPKSYNNEGFDDDGPGYSGGGGDGRDGYFDDDYGDDGDFDQDYYP